MTARKKRTVTGEVVLENGRYVEDVAFSTELVSRLRTRRGSIVPLPNYGSRLHEIKKTTSDAAVLAEKYASIAVQPMIDQRKIRSATFTATVQRTSPGAYLLIECVYRDQLGTRRSLQYNHRLGT